jgi:hypothetical protein
MQHLTIELQQALKMAGHCLNTTSRKWLLGGSCSLILQGVELLCPPRDIDLYADADSVIPLHKAIAQWSVDEQTLNKGGLYSSILSHYELNEAQIELVGAFSIGSNTFEYRVQVEDSLQLDASEIEVDGVLMSLTPLSHELIFNVLRERPDRYEAISNTMKVNQASHMPLMEKLIRNNKLEDNHIQKIAELLKAQSLLRYMTNLS